MMAECSVDYNLLFYKLRDIPLRDPEFSESLRFNGKGYDVPMLIEMIEGNNVMEIMLKGLAHLHSDNGSTGEDQEDVFGFGKSKEFKNGKKNGKKMDADEVIEIQSHLPTLNEMGVRFKLWAQTFISRVRKENMNKEERMELMKSSNPKGVLKRAELIQVQRECEETNDCKYSRQLLERMDHIFEYKG